MMAARNEDYDPEQTALDMVLALQRGDVDGWWDLWRMSPNEYDVAYALTAQSARWAQTAGEALHESAEEFLVKEHEYWLSDDA